MYAKIHDVSQFLNFCEIHHLIIEVMEENHHLIDKPIDFVKDLARETIIESTSKKNFLSKFVKEYDLTILDLDLIQLCVTQKTNNISIDTYLEKSILKTYTAKDLPLLIKNLKSTKMVQDGFIILENIFEPQEIKEKKQENKAKDTFLRDLTDLLNTELAKKRSKKNIRIGRTKKPFESFHTFIDNVFFLDKLLNKQIDSKNGSIQKNLRLLIDIHLSELTDRYKSSLTENKEDFNIFNENKMDLIEALTLIKCLTSNPLFNHKESTLSPTFDLRIVTTKSHTSLENKGLIENETFGYILTDKARNQLFRKTTLKENKLFKIETPTVTLNKISLPDETKKKLLLALNQHKNQELIFNEWGLKESLNYGKGITLNFYGVPGTGKTLTVKAIANHINKKLMTVKYSEIENKHVGETEKNITNAFKQAKEQDAILFFDEADSLTTKRENSKYSWEITRTNTLLEELENFEGICIFATNFAESYDEAFNRRLSMHIEFKLPEEQQILEILDLHFPKKEALTKDVTFKEIAKNYKGIFSGGDLKNLVLNAARLAAEDLENQEKKIAQKHIQEACTMTLANKKITQNNFKEQAGYFG